MKDEMQLINLIVLDYIERLRKKIQSRKGPLIGGMEMEVIRSLYSFPILFRTSMGHFETTGLR